MPGVSDAHLVAGSRNKAPVLAGGVLQVDVWTIMSSLHFYSEL